MECSNEDCPYYNVIYIDNCWDIGEADDCEDMLTDGGYIMKKKNKISKILSIQNWDNCSLEVLENIRDILVFDMEET